VILTINSDYFPTQQQPSFEIKHFLFPVTTVLTVHTQCRLILLFRE